VADYACLCSDHPDTNISIYSYAAEDADTLTGVLTVDCAQLVDDNVHNGSFYAIWSTENEEVGLSENDCVWMTNPSIMA